MSTALSVLSNPPPFEIVGYRTFPRYFRNNPWGNDLKVALIRTIDSPREATCKDLLQFAKIVGLIPIGGKVYDLFGTDYAKALETLATSCETYPKQGYVFTHLPDGRWGAGGIEYMFRPRRGDLHFPTNIPQGLPDVIPPGYTIIFSYDPKPGLEMVFGKGAIPT